MTYVRELEFAFLDLLQHCAKDLSAVDISNVLPILRKAVENGNFEAAFILGLYYDPNGTFFSAEANSDQRSEECAIKLYREAYDLATSSTSERRHQIIKVLEQFYKGATKPK